MISLDKFAVSRLMKNRGYDSSENAPMDPIAKDLNEIIKEGNEHIYEMLSQVGKALFFPKGILAQSAEAKEKAFRFNATIGMATEKGKTMYLPSIMDLVGEFEPEEALTYAPSFGIMPLRRVWRDTLFEKNHSLINKEISMPVVTNAITHGLSVVSDMWVDPDDAIVLPNKMWGNYNLIFAVRRGAHIVHYPLFTRRGRFNLGAFEDCVRSEAKKRQKIIVILNFPNNPTGYTVNHEEGERIVEILTNLARGGTNVLAVTDDAYFGLFYEDEVLKESLFGRLAGRDPRLLAIKLDGATKENFVWGLRVGFITYGASFKAGSRRAYDALERKTAGAVRGSISNASRLSQEIVYRSIQSKNHNAEKQEKLDILKGRAQEVKRVLADPKYQEAWETYPFNSGYFMCLRLSTMEAEPLRVHLLEKHGVGIISLGKADIRVAFSCIEKEDIQSFFDTVFQGIKELSKDI